MALFDKGNSGVYGKAGPAGKVITCPVCSAFECLDQEAILATMVTMYIPSGEQL